MKNTTFKKITITFFWMGCLIAINSNHNDFLYLLGNTKKIYSLFTYFNAVRFVLPFIIFIFAILWFLTAKKKNLFVLIFLLYGLWQIIILNIYNKYSNNLDDYFLIVCLIASLLTVFAAYEYEENKFCEILFTTIIVFITLISIYFAILFIQELSNNNIIGHLYSSKTLQSESSTLSQATPKVTGLSRLLLLISYYLFFVIYYMKHNFKYILYIILLFLNLFIYSLQSRGAIVGEFVIIVYYVLFLKDKIISKIIKIFFIFVLPILVFEFAKFEATKSKLVKDYNFQSSIKEIRILNNDTTSGRTTIWKNSLNIIKEKKIIFGVGPQGDRKLLGEYLSKNSKNKLDEIYGSNSSNALMYSYLSGGFICLSLLLFIYFLTIKELFNGVIVNKLHSNNNLLVNFSIVTIIFLLLRSIFENGFSLFGIDFCFFVLSYFFLAKKNFEKTKN